MRGLNLLVGERVAQAPRTASAAAWRFRLAWPGQCGLRRRPCQRRGHMPVHWLFRPISIAVATCSRVEDGFDNTAETSFHFVDALSRSPVHPVSMKANRRTAMILILGHQC